MFTACMEWRNNEGIDTILEDFVFEEADACQQIYPHGYHGVDKLGRPVYIERFGILNIPKLFEATTRERFLRHQI